MQYLSSKAKYVLSLAIWHLSKTRKTIIQYFLVLDLFLKVALTPSKVKMVLKKKLIKDIEKLYHILNLYKVGILLNKQLELNNYLKILRLIIQFLTLEMAV